MGSDTPPPPPILTTMALSISLLELLLVALDLTKFVKGHGTSHIENPPISQDLASDGGGNIGGRGCRGGRRCVRHFRHVRSTYVGWIAVPSLVRNFQDGLVMMMGFLI